MANDSDFVAHCRELLSPLGAVRVRRMFGGHGLYVDDCFIALISADVLYLKTDEATRPAFEAAGSQPFGYTTHDGRRTVLSYWQAPDDAMDSPALMLPWARQALGAALRAANRPAAKRTRAPRSARSASSARQPRSGGTPAR